MDRLYLVVPCYNEEEVLPETVRRLTDKLRRMEEKGLVSGDSRILLVDDGSRDRTWELICGFHQENPTAVSYTHLDVYKRQPWGQVVQPDRLAAAVWRLGHDGLSADAAAVVAEENDCRLPFDCGDSGA